MGRGKVPGQGSKGSRKPWRTRCTYGKKIDSQKRVLLDVTLYWSMGRFLTLSAEDAITIGRELIEEAHNAKCLERCSIPD